MICIMGKQVNINTVLFFICILFVNMQREVMQSDPEQQANVQNEIMEVDAKCIETDEYNQSK